ncbi:hypothetical protein HFP51_14010 [Parasphingopyxis sp. CP4]|uniref:hypothetical protein n=1 Tax=Parasphingopyxis sp. CP4 TaxID=2724527 RepID=UPI0015A4729F|nr:hypothetical protein [Parasphingopyxis sp. CP4]QLC23201.1 hypothetical protein HFP51_14010 [Parasphingopyxis sp. CP4]
MTAAAPPIGNENKQDFDQAYDRLIESERFQTEMSPFEVPEPDPPPAWLANFLEWLGTLGPFWEALFWIAAVGIGGLILFSIGRSLVRYFSDRQPAIEEEEEDEIWRPEAKAAIGLLGDADALAQQGRYAEAVHLLLHRSVADIEERLPDFLRPALTSRDISRAETLPSPARSAFTSIATVVERGIFATRPVDEQGWSEARSAYEEFAFGKSWQ